ncbi:McrC family protein [Sporosarcina sp. PTS2304]|uniref:McrC family protein n=1 Tax=Sporosarcina sp. PTS2304 TaxID=2283194 RepID=UPI0013B42B61|nr:McrC family protein [Sporosarcina sp. PTS2304]
MNKRLTVKEFDSFTRNLSVDHANYHMLDDVTFDLLEQFILDSTAISETSDDIASFLSIGNVKGIGKVIRTKNYVGVLKLKNGTEIEILPKIHSPASDLSEEETKRVFLTMLMHLPNLPFKKFTMANLQLADHHVLELFIQMFLTEVKWLLTRGLKSDYQAFAGNEVYYKGKLNITQHIRYNLAHKERFHVTYDQLDLNRTENRLIKTALLHIQTKTSHSMNKKDIKSALQFFDQVETIYNPNDAFSTLTNDRNMKDYRTVLEWCKVFLQNKSFTTFSGTSVAYALLFPMEKVYEAYIAGVLKRTMDNRIYAIYTQDRTHSLFDVPKRFALRPDIVIEHNEKCIVLDTKWKILKNDLRSNYGISQADMYQMFAYHHKYDAECVILVYPWNNGFPVQSEPIQFSSHDSVIMYIFFINLYEIEKSMNHLAELVSKKFA